MVLREVGERCEKGRRKENSGVEERREERVEK